MIPLYQTLFLQDIWWSYLLRFGLWLLAAWLLQKLSWRIAGRLARLGRFSRSGRKGIAERQRTIRGIIANTIGSLGFLVAILVGLSYFVGMVNVIWIVGLFSAAFGLGARPLISDFLTGLSFIFDDTFAVGDKVEILGVEGVVENVMLRNTLLRAPTGELYVVPNGEVRVVRNFSRGRFSMLDIKLKLAGVDLGKTLPLLEEVGKEAVTALPNLLEPWHIISESGVIGQQTELTLMAKARFGKAAEMRPRLLALVQERLAEAGIELAN